MNITNAMKMVAAAKFTGTQNRTLAAGPCFMTRRIVTCVALSIWIGLSFNGSILEAATLPTADTSPSRFTSIGQRPGRHPAGQDR